MSGDPPEHVATDAHMLQVWKRSQHILPAIAFERKYWRTVLLPLQTEKVRRDVKTLLQIILRDRQPTQVQLVRVAASEYGLKNGGRTKMLLAMRRGLEWDWDTLDIPARRYSFFAVRESPLARLIPSHIPIEYLVAELERHRFKFYIREGRRFLAQYPENPMPLGEVTAWLESHGPEIAEYIANRDGTDVVVLPGDKLIWEPPDGES